MWTVIKFDRKNFNYLKYELKKNFGDNCTLYRPKLLVQHFKKNKLVDRELDLLGDYVFCYYQGFEKKNILTKLKFVKGLKYFLDGFQLFQKDIISFIDRCKKFENEIGFISQDFFKIDKFSKYKFSSGPFVGKIFQIIDLQKTKIKILIGKTNTLISKKGLLFKPI